MPKLKLDNVTLESDSVTWQGVFVEWIKTQISAMYGPNGEVPTDAEIKAELLSRFREMRARIMAEYDWMFLEDSPATANAKQKAAAFRQALRDIPQNYPDIRDAVFPDPDA